NDMNNTDSKSFQNHCPSVSLRENRRVAEIGNGSDPHWHQTTDKMSTFSDDDVRLAFNSLQSTLGFLTELTGATIVNDQCMNVFTDTDNDGIADAVDNCPNTPNSSQDDQDNDGFGDVCDSCIALDNTLIGTPCNDNDPCTSGELYDNNCGCTGGTFADDDNDGICDANDQCPGANDNLIGTTCDDGSACTINDIYDTNCQCSGTPLSDSDNDGICDSEDQCPGINDALIGSSCDDGDACTTGEVYDDNCNCSGGITTDSDSDGICDAQDPCPNDPFDICDLPSYCSSKGSSTQYEFIQSVNIDNIDNDSGNNNGYSDFTSIHTNLTPGMSYDIVLTPGFSGSAYSEYWKIWIDYNVDGDFSDSGEEVFTANGNGVLNGSVLIPANTSLGSKRMRVSMKYNSNSSSCGDFDFGEVEDYTVVIKTSCNVGVSCDDGDACTEGEAYDSNCNCTGGVTVDTDNDGTPDCNDGCPNDANKIETGQCGCGIADTDSDSDGTSDCNDACPNDANKISIGQCGCGVSDIDSDSDGTADCNDECPNDANKTIAGECGCGIADNDTDNDGTADCNDSCPNSATGDSDGDGVCDDLDICNGFDDSLDADNDGIPDGCDSCPNDSDSDNDGVCDDLDICSGFDDNLDADNDSIPDGCDSCPNSASGDSDGDGVCDDLDICNGFDDNLDVDNDGTPDGCDSTQGSCTLGTSCTSTDPCMTNAVFDTNCQCVGTLIDADNDGICSEQDPDDNDPCVPNQSSACNTCQEIISDGFESGFGNWIDGGSDAYRTNANANTGTWAIGLQDNNTTGTITSQALDLRGFSEITVDFSYYVVSFDNANEDFWLQISNNDGQSYSTVEEWNLTDEFNNNQRKNDSVTIAGPFSQNTRLRFRSDASGNADDVYLDDIVVNGCGADNSCTIGNSCDDGDNCTINDAYNAQCVCTGTLTDNDNDGICIGDDPNDNDPCVPNECQSCTELDSEGFESGLGIWNDGGSDAFRLSNSGFANNGSYSFRIRDNSGSNSSVFTDPMDWSSYATANVHFSYFANSMENNEDFFLEISTNGGSSFSVYQEWNSGTEFTNGVRYNETIEISGITFTTNVVIRFRCDATANGDQIYLDDIIIEGCGVNNIIANEIKTNARSHSDKSGLVSVTIMPNPVAEWLTIDGVKKNNVAFEIYNTAGVRLIKSNFYRPSINVSKLENGLYFIRLSIDGEQVIKKFIKGR
ncbi:MAG: GEVED domain-containing protein, partial [Saprospiraceae bacterium]